jgi:hypothetical protein
MLNSGRIEPREACRAPSSTPTRRWPVDANHNDPIHPSFEAIVSGGSLAGATTLIWRKGEVVQRACVGWRDREADLPIEHDTIFRIASMTKPITSTAALMLAEEWRCSAPRSTENSHPLPARSFSCGPITNRFHTGPDRSTTLTPQVPG